MEKDSKNLLKDNSSLFLLLTDLIEIHQSKPDSMTQRRLEDHTRAHTSGCNWWISIQSVNNTQDRRTFWERFHGCFFPKSRINVNCGNIVSSVFSLADRTLEKATLDSGKLDLGLVFAGSNWVEP